MSFTGSLDTIVFITILFLIFLYFRAMSIINVSHSLFFKISNFSQTVEWERSEFNKILLFLFVRKKNSTLKKTRKFNIGYEKVSIQIFWQYDFCLLTYFLFCSWHWTGLWQCHKDLQIPKINMCIEWNCRIRNLSML